MQSYTKATEWFLRAAEQGIVEAQFNLGEIYEKNLEVTNLEELAAKWYRMAADQDDARAQFNSV